MKSQKRFSQKNKKVSNKKKIFTKYHEQTPEHINPYYEETNQIQTPEKIIDEKDDDEFDENYESLEEKLKRKNSVFELKLTVGNEFKITSKVVLS